MFSISVDFHLNSRPTNRSRMSGCLASPLFVRIHLVETNSLPLAADSSTFSYTGRTCQGTQLLDLCMSHLLWIQLCSSKNFTTWFSSYVCKSCLVIPGSNALMLSNPSSCNCCFKPFSNAVTTSAPLSPVLVSLQRFPVCATF